MNQTPRRSMADALQTPSLPPEAIALIKAGTPKPQTSSPIISAPVSPKTVEAAMPKPANDTPVPAKPKLQKEKPAEIVSMVPMNTRVSADLSQALLKASSERKLKKVHPYTQQDIVAEALSNWLKKNGLLD